MATVAAGVSTNSTAGGASLVSGAFTPVAGDLLIVWVFATACVVTTPTLTASANGLTFTLIPGAKATKNAGADTMYCFKSNQPVPPSPVSMTVTAGGLGAGCTGTFIYVRRIDGMSRFDSTAVRQVSTPVDNAAGGTTPSTSFSVACLTTNPTLGAVMVTSGTNAVTGPSSWTEHADLSIATPTAGFEDVSRNSGFTGTTITWGGNVVGSNGYVAIELDTSTSITSFTKDLILKYNTRWGDDTWLELTTHQWNSLLTWADPILENFTKDLIVKWNVKSSFTKDLTIVYNVKSSFTKDLILVYNVKNSFFAQVKLLWNVQESFTKDETILWTVLTSFTKDEIILWNTLAGLTSFIKDEILVWNVIGSFTKDEVLLWNVKVSFTKDESLLWNVRSSFISDETLVWNVLSSFAKNEVLLWNVLESFTKDEIIKWNVSASFNKDVVVLWNVQSLIVLYPFTKDITFLWNIADIWVPVEDIPEIWNRVLDSLETYTPKSKPGTLWSVQTDNDEVYTPDLIVPTSWTQQ